MKDQTTDPKRSTNSTQDKNKTKQNKQAKNHTEAYHSKTSENQTEALKAGKGKHKKEITFKGTIRPTLTSQQK